MVTIEIKENSKQAKAFIELAKTLSFVNFKENAMKPAQDETKDYPISKNVPNAETARSIEKNKKSEGTRSKNSKELFEKLGI